MQISTRSWHYRVIDFFDWSFPHNLCGYCWLVLWASFVMAVILPIVGVLAVALVTSPFWFWLQSTYVLTQVGLGVGVIEAVILFLILRAIIIERWTVERRSGERSPIRIREPSLFWLWIKARHDNVCPLLDFVDKGDER